MILAQSHFGGSDTGLLLGLLIVICLMLCNAYLFLQITALLLLKGKRKLLAVPGLIFPLAVLAVFLTEPYSADARIGIMIIGCVVGVYLLLLNIFLAISNRTHPKPLEKW